MEAIFGSIILEFIGALTKYLIYSVIAKIKGRKVVSFKLIWQGRKKSNEMDYVLNGFSNTLVGAVVLTLLLFLLVDVIF